MKRKREFVQWQDVKVLQTKRIQSGESSPYWEWIRDHESISSSHGPDSVDMNEPAQGNPDILPEQRTQFHQETRISVGDISKKLSGQQLKVFEMYVQEGKSIRDIAIVLGIGKRTVETYLSRIRERFKYFV